MDLTTGHAVGMVLGIGAGLVAGLLHGRLLPVTATRTVPPDAAIGTRQTSKAPSSRRSFTATRNRDASAPSTRRWSYVSDR